MFHLLISDDIWSVSMDPDESQSYCIGFDNHNIQVYVEKKSDNGKQIRKLIKDNDLTKVDSILFKCLFDEIMSNTDEIKRNDLLMRLYNAGRKRGSKEKEQEIRLALGIKEKD